MCQKLHRVRRVTGVDRREGSAGPLEAVQIERSTPTSSTEFAKFPLPSEWVLGNGPGGGPLDSCSEKRWASKRMLAVLT